MLWMLSEKKKQHSTWWFQLYRLNFVEKKKEYNYITNEIMWIQSDMFSCVKGENSLVDTEEKVAVRR